MKDAGQWHGNRCVVRSCLHNACHMPRPYWSIALPLQDIRKKTTLLWRQQRSKTDLGPTWNRFLLWLALKRVARLIRCGLTVRRVIVAKSRKSDQKSVGPAAASSDGPKKHSETATLFSKGCFCSKRACLSWSSCRMSVEGECNLLFWHLPPCATGRAIGASRRQPAGQGRHLKSMNASHSL